MRLNKFFFFPGHIDLVFYLEACESGSMFDGLLTENKDIYMAFPLCRAPG